MAIALSKEKIEALTGLNLIYSFLVLFAVNIVVLYLAYLLLPGGIVLGTHALTLLWALLLTTCKLTMITTAVTPLLRYYEWKNGEKLGSREWLLAYVAVSIISIWCLARIAAIIGFGISSWYVALAVGLALGALQKTSLMTMAKYTK
ncbi:MAG: hypothetical protein ABII21_03270 [bacterium]